MNTATLSPHIPNCIETEQALLGAVLLDQDILLSLTVPTTAFYLEKHQWIYAAMLALYERQTPIDFISLCAELSARGQLNNIGGEAYIVALANAVPTAANAPTYAEEINHKAMQRKLIAASGDIAGIGFDSVGLTQEEMLSKAQAVVTNLETTTPGDDLMPWYDAVGQALPRIQDYLDGTGQKDQFIPTGLRAIDCLMGGLPRGEMTLIAADPGMGKTHLVETIAFNAARTRTHQGIFFSLEMRREQLLERHFAERANIHVKDLRMGNVSIAAKDKMFDGVGETDSIPLWISDRPRDTAGILRAILKMQRRAPIDFAVVDYSLLLRDFAKTEVERNINLSHALKNIAKQTNVALVVVHPISREADPQEPPELRHLGWGRVWEYDSYFVLFPFFKSQRAENDFNAMIKIGKWRDGKPGGEQKAFFNGIRWGDLLCS